MDNIFKNSDLIKTLDSITKDVHLIDWQYSSANTQLFAKLA